MTLQFFDAATLPAMRWRNGGGTTRELACFPAGAGMDSFGWRISIADIDADGPFSAFDGIDRIITLLDGPGVRLQAAQAAIDHRLDQALQPYAFAGEAPIMATLLGGSTRDFNVMTRRGDWRAAVQPLHAATTLDSSDAGLIYVQTGQWRLLGNGQDRTLSPGQGCYWTGHAGPFSLTPASADAALLAVALHHEGQA